VLPDIIIAYLDLLMKAPSIPTGRGLCFLHNFAGISPSPIPFQSLGAVPLLLVATRCYTESMSYPRHPRLDPDFIKFGFIIVVIGFVVIMIGVALGLWPLPFSDCKPASPTSTPSILPERGFAFRSRLVELLKTGMTRYACPTRVCT
jgi:hypothetical protein